MDNALPMKQIPQALNIRSKILENYENALLSSDETELNSLMDIVIVGGGPTGVELAGAISELKKSVLPKDLPELDFSKMDIYLLEAMDRLLFGMSDKAGKQALKYLQDFGVKVKFRAAVKSYDGYKVKLGDGSEILSQTVIWAAGVTGNLIDGLKPESIKGGRYVVNEFNQIEGYDNLFAIGDAAGMFSSEKPKGHPMLAQVAIQQGRRVGKNLHNLLTKKPQEKFVYRDKGSMATIGRNKAVVDFPKFSISGIFAWFIWMFVHLLFLIGFRNKVTTFINWIWNYFTFDRATRLIIRPWRKNSIDTKE
jgi:NADH dehydrogenase